MSGAIRQIRRAALLAALLLATPILAQSNEGTLGALRAAAVGEEASAEGIVTRVERSVYSRVPNRITIADGTGSIVIEIWEAEYIRLPFEPVRGSALHAVGTLFLHAGERRLRVIDPTRVEITLPNDPARAPLAEEAVSIRSLRAVPESSLVTVEGVVTELFIPNFIREATTLHLADSTGSITVTVWPEAMQGLSARLALGDRLRVLGVLQGRLGVVVQHAVEIEVLESAPPSDEPSSAPSEPAPEVISQEPEIPQRSPLLGESREERRGGARYEEHSGVWRTGRGTSSAEGVSEGIGHRWVDIGSSGGSSRAQWTFTPEQFGLYDVQVTWPRGANAMNVAFALNAGGEDLTTTVTQDGTGPPDESNANQWISIGGFEAGPSIPLTLTLSDWSVTGPSNGGMPARMVAGASRLVLIEERPAPPTAPELVAVEPDAPPAPPPSLEMTLAPDPEIEVTLNATPTDMPEPEPTEDFPPLPLAANIAWLTEPNVALSIANASDRELVIFIHAPGDRDAMQMLARAWSDPEVISLIADRYVAAQIDLDRHRSFCAGFGITRGPSVVRHDTSSGAISRLIGRSEANALRELLE